MNKPMYIALSRHNIAVFYKCYNLKLRYGKKCPDKNTNKCLHCQYSKAEMSGSDATMLLDAFGRHVDE